MQPFIWVLDFNCSLCFDRLIIGFIHVKFHCLNPVLLMGAITKPGVLCTVQVTFCQFLFIFSEAHKCCLSIRGVFVCFILFFFFMLTLSCVAVTTANLSSFELIVKLLTDCSQLLQGIKCCSLCYTVGPCCLSIIYSSVHMLIPSFYFFFHLPTHLPTQPSPFVTISLFSMFWSLFLFCKYLNS